MKNIRVFLIFLAAALFYLLFNSHIPITDPVEGNYALTAKEMLTSGDWLSPRIYGQFWYDKPAMIYWLILISYKLFGVNEFAARFPPAIFSAFSVAFLYWFADRIYNRRVALWSAVVLATSLEYWILAKLVITDAVLFFFTSVSMAAYYLGLLGQGRKWYFVAYSAVALAVLTKGPVGIVLPGLTIFVYSAVTRRWELLRDLFKISRLVVFFLVAAPWYLYMYKMHGSVFIDTFFGLHNYIRATVSEHPQYNVFYYYLVLFPVMLLPWTGIFLRMAVKLIKEIRSEHILYLLIWAAVIIVFYTAMATKYPTYVFPAVFPVAILMGRHLESMLCSGGRKQWLWLTIPALMLFTIMGTGVRILSPTQDWKLVYAILAISFIAILVVQYKSSGSQILRSVTASTVIVILLLNSQVFPYYADTRSAKRIAEQLPETKATVAAYGDYPTSAVFYSGYRLPELVNNSGGLVPKGAWAGKYTMPRETVGDFARKTHHNKDTYIIVKHAQLKEFQKTILVKEFVPVFTHAEFILFKGKYN
ncbi:dolichyl-phosphate-mannose-protein mannosyltransferase [Lucifera butyrica]|uniref:Dolichyl-phosphate-mannose-protein mannosyltransferase n=1 Tax=Lucifera butyrica TaxID=1351585 RepID=A0A498RA67_9FIRM|nr:glycosyltransferase family 39 protein [Lucifera butyrica]VBB08281.1 dolichyl-phosphate-mannose-protein mannosyltransferase [Lucifera butyrica]